MKLPNSTQMSKEQKDIYLNSPLTGNILISGAPGTGKTVIAFLRAQSIAKQKKKVTVIMFNNVLTSYTKNAADEKFDVQTFHKWSYSWWNSLDLGDSEWEPETRGKMVYLPRCAGFDRPRMKEIFGDSWFKFDFKFKKQWFTNNTHYHANKKFLEYAKPLEEMPKEDEWSPDWEKIIDKLVANKDKLLKDQSVNWRHLIIDEGQDFSRSMYKAFYMIQEILFKKNPEKPALTVFADENQRIREENSTLSDIEKELNINDECSYKLSYNYRNTREVAKFSAEFYVGLKTGIPEFPEKKGEKPKLISCSSYSKSIDYISRYINNHENEEIGIFVQNHDRRKKIIKDLKKKLSSEKIIIQSYQYNDQEHADPRNLKFDVGGLVTVVTKHSCKGLEFDTVFIPEIQEISIDPGSIELFRMEMYVMTSRARAKLFLLLTNQDDSDLQILDYLPQKEKNLMEHINE
jgi:DNA helicase II / ATP-dependent DNA helicase PcrA